MTYEWKQLMGPTIILSREMAEDYASGSELRALLDVGMNEASRMMMQELQLDIDYGWDSRHKPDRGTYATIVTAQRWHERGERLYDELGGRGQVAWRVTR